MKRFIKKVLTFGMYIFLLFIITVVGYTLFFSSVTSSEMKLESDRIQSENQIISMAKNDKNYSDELDLFINEKDSKLYKNGKYKNNPYVKLLQKNNEKYNELENKYTSIYHVFSSQYRNFFIFSLIFLFVLFVGFIFI